MVNMMEDNYKSMIQKLIFYTFTMGVSMTMFGPIFHYVCWPISLFLLIFAKYKYQESHWPSFSSEGKKLFYLLSVFFLFSLVVYFVNSADHSNWLRASSISLEILIGFLLAARILNTEEARGKFINIFSAINIIGFIWLIFSQLNGVNFSTKTFFNHNIIGFYLVIVFPIIFMDVVFYCKNVYIRGLLFCVIFVSLMLSFSSISWLACSIQLIIILIYIKIIYRIKLFKLIVLSFLFLLTFTFLVNYNGNGALTQRLNVEFDQITGIDNLDKLTSNRVEVWEAALSSIKQKPILGYGHDQFSKRHKAFLSERYGAKDPKTTSVLNHPHNMYLERAFETGIFGMLLFVAALVFPIINITRHYLNKDLREDFPWSLIFFTVFLGQIVYGLAGESLFDMRRDLSVVLWVVLGIYSVYDFKSQKTVD